MKVGDRHLRKRPRDLRCRPQIERCGFCGLDPWGEDVAGCVDLDIKGRSRVPLDWGDDWPPGERPDNDNPCACGAQVGRLHHHGCNIEECPWTAEHPDEGSQLLYCGCVCDSCDDHPPGPCTHEDEP